MRVSADRPGVPAKAEGSEGFCIRVTSGVDGRCPRKDYFVKSLPADILCEFCEVELAPETAVQNAYGNCCSACNRKVQDFVLGETGESRVMLQIAELVTKYGDASYDCGEHSGDRYEDCVEKLRDARKALMKFVSENVQK